MCFVTYIFNIPKHNVSILLVSRRVILIYDQLPRVASGVHLEFSVLKISVYGFAWFFLVMLVKTGVAIFLQSSHSKNLLRRLRFHNISKPTNLGKTHNRFFWIFLLFSEKVDHFKHNNSILHITCSLLLFSIISDTFNFRTLQSNAYGLDFHRYQYFFITSVL